MLDLQTLVPLGVSSRLIIVQTSNIPLALPVWVSNVTPDYEAFLFSLLS